MEIKLEIYMGSNGLFFFFTYLFLIYTFVHLTNEQMYKKVIIKKEIIKEINYFNYYLRK